MAHHERTDPNNPYLQQLRELCLEFPGAAEKVSHGFPVFYTKKIFAIFGAVLKGDHYTTQHQHALVFLPDADERAGLLADERFFVPAYYGPSGWVGIDLDAPGCDWEEVAELVTDSFRNTAPRKLVAELEA